MTRRRRRSSRLLGYLFLLPLAPMVVIAGLFLWIDPNDYKPQVVAALRAATGHDVAVRGDLRLELDLPPVLHVSDVEVANPPGFTTPNLLSVAQVDADLSWWPLLFGRIDIRHLALVRPELNLEINQAGVGNWMPPRAAPAPSATADAGVAPAPAPEQAAPAPQPRDVRLPGIQAVRTGTGRINIRDGRTGRTRLIEVLRLDVTSNGPREPIVASADVRFDGRPMSLSGQTGSLAALVADGAGAPWPVQGILTAAGARLSATGALTQPLTRRSYTLKFDLKAPDLAPVGGLIGTGLPGLRDVSATVSAANGSGAVVLSGLVAQAGGGDLGLFVPGLTVSQLEFSAAAMDREIGGTLDGALGSVPIHGSGVTGTLAMLAGAVPAGGRVPVDLHAEGGGTTLAVKGTIGPGDQGGSLDLGVTMKVGTLADLGTAIGRKLPVLNDVSASAHVADPPGGLARGVVLRNLMVQAPAGDVGGSLDVAWGAGVPSVKGELSGRRLDVDAILQGWRLLAGKAPPPQPASPSALPQREEVRDGRLFSPVPFASDWLRAADLDLSAAIGEIRSSGTSYRDVTAHVVLDGGALRIDRVAASLPGGRLDGRAALDGRVPEWPMSLALHAPGLALQPVLATLGLPSDVAGLADVDADLTSSGRTPRAVAASLAGRLGLAMTDAEFDNRLLGLMLGDLLRAARMPPDLLAGGVNGRTQVRCVATRFDFTRGPGMLESLLLDSSRMQFQAAGGFNLADESLALRLRTVLRLGGQSVAVPMRMGGTFLNPQLRVDSADTGRAVAGAALAAIGRGKAATDATAGAVPAAAPAPEPTPAETCAAALGLARGARPAAP